MPVIDAAGERNFCDGIFGEPPHKRVPDVSDIRQCGIILEHFLEFVFKKCHNAFLSKYRQRPTVRALP